MDLTKIEEYTLDNVSEIFKEKVDAILIINAELDRYRSISKKGVFSDIIEESGNYHDLIEKLWVNINSSSKKFQKTIMSLFLYMESLSANIARD